MVEKRTGNLRNRGGNHHRLHFLMLNTVMNDHKQNYIGMTNNFASFLMLYNIKMYVE